MPDDSKTPLDQALELFLYAPLGLALTARDNLPSLIERGRQQVTGQMMMAKMMGQFAVAEAQKQARERVEKVTESFTAPRPAPQPAASSAPSATPAPAPEKASSNGKATAPEAPGPEAVPTSDHLAIPAYDTLSASQVVQRLAGLSADELEAVRAYEAATRGRRTILTKISQLGSS